MEINILAWHEYTNCVGYIIVMADFTATVASFDESIATLASPDHQLFQMPLSLLPGDLAPGNMLRFTIDVDHEAELKRRQAIYKLLDDVAIYVRSRKGSAATVPDVPEIAQDSLSRRISVDSIKTTV